MQFDNPMPQYQQEIDPESGESIDGESVAADQDFNLQEQLRSQVESNLNIRSVLHGTFYAVLIFVMFLMFLEIEFDILDDARVNGMIALVVILGGASTLVPSKMDDKVYDLNDVPSSLWRFIIFIFFIANEILLLFLVRELINILGIVGLAVLAGIVGAVNLAVLWQFVDEEFDDYLEPTSDRRTVVSNYVAMVIVSGLVVLIEGNIPIIDLLTSALSLFLFLLFSGLFWTYALFDRETINVLSRIALSFLISIMLLPLAALLLNRLGLEMTSVAIVLINFAIASLGFLAYTARPRFKRWLYAG